MLLHVLKFRSVLVNKLRKIFCNSKRRMGEYFSSLKILACTVWYDSGSVCYAVCVGPCFRNEREIGGMESAHDSFIWNLSWHPLGHILVSCSSDHTSKFWCRNRPGEEMRDKYNTASALITEDTVEGSEVLCTPSATVAL